MIKMLRPHTLLRKIMLSTSVAITLLFAATGWIVVKSATHATSASVKHEVQASFQAYQSLWKARADRLASITSILSAMSDVRAAFGTGDEATIRDTASELWTRVSDDEAIFLVTDPRGIVIASLGGLPRDSLPAELLVVRGASSRFPGQASGFVTWGDQMYHLTITPVYVQTTGGTALLNVLVAGYAINRGVAERLKSATGGSEFLFLSRGRVVASTLHGPDEALIASQLSGSNSTVRSGSSEYAPLITPLADIHGSEAGQLVILRSYEAANREIAALQRNISLLWLLSMAAGLTLTYLLARRVIEPVKELDRAAAQVARQNYDYEVRVSSDDELGRLAATFNAMCASIRQAREELIRSERTTAIGRLATSIVHDLRNPLAAIYGGAEMLMDPGLSEHQIRRLARNMYRASQHIQELLQDLLELGRGRSGVRRRCDLRELVSRVAESLSPTAEAQSMRVLVDVPEGVDLLIDEHRIGRALANLVGNALQAMAEGGTVTVTATAGEGSVLVEVQDTGPGIPAEIRDRLFQPFVTSGKGSGLGLGLALARQAIVDHGGDMWATSTPGHGACFSFRLPVQGAGDHLHMLTA
ncbi:MAG TPA: ATP-binding protein [Bryobacteraceae bacterium]|nr:ATP-binding protein [Bryobacteraceae bacterium]